MIDTACARRLSTVQRHLRNRPQAGKQSACGEPSTSIHRQDCDHSISQPHINCKYVLQKKAKPLPIPSHAFSFSPFTQQIDVEGMDKGAGFQAFTKSSGKGKSAAFPSSAPARTLEMCDLRELYTVYLEARQDVFQQFVACGCARRLR